MTGSGFSASLADIDAQGLRRNRRVFERLGAGRLGHQGRVLLDFAGNDYLDLARHPTLIAAAHEALDRYGVGSGASHLICGHGPEHHRLEDALAEFTGRDRALVFSTGFMANLALISTLAGRHDVVIEDRLNHASLLDGAKLAGARLKRYPHADLAGLESLIGGDAQTPRLIVTDGVFSMDGDIAPLTGLAALAKACGALLMVDDAHGLGVLGPRGGGCLEQLNLTQTDVPILIGTFGKALGSFGAFVAGSADLIELLIQKARPYIYTTALPPAIAKATSAALDVVHCEPWRRDRLHALVSRFRKGATRLGLKLLDSQTPIQPVIIGDNALAMQAAGRLFEAGFVVGAIRPPTVPAGSARLRITLSAAHDEDTIDRLLDALEQSRVADA